LLRIKGDLRLGLPVVLQDGQNRILAALVESVSEDRFLAMTSTGRPELVLTRRRAAALGARWSINADVLRLKIQRGSKLSWLHALAGQRTDDGLTGTVGNGPLLAGTPEQVAAINLAKSTQAMPAVLTVPFEGDPGATALMTMTVQDINAALAEAHSAKLVSSASLPLDVLQTGHVHVFRPDDGGPEHYAIKIGTPDLGAPVTVRLHSACFTGDVFGSLKCDCGPQLREAMNTMADGVGGVILYLNQEGRGIGLANKMRSYVLQDAGLDTVEANHWLGFEDDQRDFRIGASILHQLGIRQVKLMTNNPAKVHILAGHGIDVVERLSLRVGRTAQNKHYLSTKARKSGHLL
jgi:GTP cyclohydrolase II